MSGKLNPVDFNHLDGIVNGDENFKRELIKIFLEQIPDFIKNMKMFLDNNNLENLAREAHTAKSSAMIFGMTNAGDKLKDIQLFAENNNLDEIRPAFEVVKADFENAEIQLLEFIKL